MDTIKLCAGTLEVEHPDDVLLDYVDVRNGYSYPAYDLLTTPQGASTTMPRASASPTR